MKAGFGALGLAGVAVLGLIGARPVNTGPMGSLKWVTGYWYSPPVYGGLSVSDIDYSALTHIIHFSVQPKSDGTLEPTSFEHITDFAPDLITTAHANGVKALISVAQATSASDFNGATSDAAVVTLVSRIMALIEAYGYDGVDINWETNVDSRQFVRFVSLLRSRLDQLSPRGLLTGAFWQPSPYHLTDIQEAFDQVNVMTYDMCSPEEGFSWHNAALYDAGDRGRRTVERRMSCFVELMPASKLGLGIPFYGFVWETCCGPEAIRVTGPGQVVTGAPKFYFLSYREMVSDLTLWRKEHKRRDETAGRVPYLSIASPDVSNVGFVTYDDEISVAEKVRYARTRGLGGVMIWELSGDHLPESNPKHPLLQAVKTASGRQ